jgi:hypothetical protein
MFVAKGSFSRNLFSLVLLHFGLTFPAIFFLLRPPQGTKFVPNGLPSYHLQSYTYLWDRIDVLEEKSQEKPSTKNREKYPNYLKFAGDDSGHLREKGWMGLAPFLPRNSSMVVDCINLARTRRIEERQF